MNFFEFNKQFPTELDCIKYFIIIRYNNQIQCNHCNSDKVTVRKNTLKNLNAILVAKFFLCLKGQYLNILQQI